MGTLIHAPLDRTAEPIAAAVGPVVSELFDEPPPIAFEFWDGSVFGDDIVGRVRFTGPTAFRHLMWSPDELGLACDFRQHSFELPFINFRAMPYFPNYRLGTTPTYPCDSTIVVNLTTSTTTIPQVKTAVKLYPNPVKSGGFLTVALQKGVNGKLLLYDLLGRLVLSQDLVASAAMVEVRLPEGMEAGIYFYALRGEEGEVVSGKVVVECG